MICKTCGKQFTGEACPTCGIKPESEGRSDELVKLLKNATDGGNKYREGYEKGLQEGYRNGYTAASRDSRLDGPVSDREAPETTGSFMDRSFSFKQFLIAAGACFAVGALIFGLLFGALRYTSGYNAGHTAGENTARAEAKDDYDKKLNGERKTARDSGHDEGYREGYGKGFDDGALKAEEFAAEARTEAAEKKLSEQMAGEIAAFDAEADEPVGMKIIELQEKLITLGYSDVTADGFFGPQTKKALERFREEENLGEGAVLDRETEERIYYRLKVKEAASAGK